MSVAILNSEGISLRGTDHHAQRKRKRKKEIPASPLTYRSPLSAPYSAQQAPFVCSRAPEPEIVFGFCQSIAPSLTKRAAHLNFITFFSSTIQLNELDFERELM